MIAGDSLLVMNSLLEKEGMAGKVQMVYFDPPYGIKYGSNFQPFVNKRDVTDGKDEDLSSEPEMIKAFRDTWELGIHSYITYLRDRLLLSAELMHASGSVFVQISNRNEHLIRNVLDEVFGPENYVSSIVWKKAAPNSSTIKNNFNFLLWYCKDKTKIKVHKIYRDRLVNEGASSDPKKLALRGEFPDGTERSLTTKEKRVPDMLPEGTRVYRVQDIYSPSANEENHFEFEFNGKDYLPPKKKSWRGNPTQMGRLKSANRIVETDEGLGYKFYVTEDSPLIEITNLWEDTAGNVPNMIYVVQTNEKLIQRCLMMTTDPGDITFDPTCGSGTTAIVSEQWGRRWITTDTSRVALTLAKQRLIVSTFDYYKLAYRNEGIGSGLRYKISEHVTLKSIANELTPTTKTLYDRPYIDSGKNRIAGPFTVEAVPAPYAKSFDELEQEDCGSDTSIARTGETHRQSEWRDELMRTGVRAKAGKIIEFSRVEPLSGTKFIQAEAETKEDIPKKVLVVFGPEHAPLEQRQVEDAWQEARALGPDMLLFCAFQFDDEAAKDIDELTPNIAGMQLIKAQMNADMLTDDLRKKRSSNESFWLVGQPDVKIHKKKDGKIQVEVMGFDYYNPKTGNVDSGGKKNIAMWMLDTDYNNRSLFPSQVFFPMAGNKDGWSKLAKNLKAELDEEKIEAFKGTTSLEFEPGNTIAVKIIDDRGIESLRVINI